MNYYYPTLTANVNRQKNKDFENMVDIPAKKAATVTDTHKYFMPSYLPSLIF